MVVKHIPTPSIRTTLVVTAILVLLTTGCLLSQATNESRSTCSISNADLRFLLLKQPDFRAELEFDTQDLQDEEIDSWAEHIMKKGDLYRFEMKNKDKNGTHPMILLAYPGEKITVILPEEKAYRYIDEKSFSQAAFTGMMGVEAYYFTKLIADGASKFECVSQETNFKGHECIKVRLINNSLSSDMGLERLMVANGPMYFFVAKDLNNLIVGATVADEDGKQVEAYSLKGISLGSGALSAELFRVPSGFQERQ